MIKQYDCIIVGGGIVGGTLACLLGQAGHNVLVLERQLAQAMSQDATYELRVSAISRITQQAFMDIGAWQTMQALRVAAYESMVVWDASGSGEIRFAATDLGEPDLGHIIENRVIQLALQQRMQQIPTIEVMCPAQAVSSVVHQDKVQLTLASGEVCHTALLVGADGAHSMVRDWANIPIIRTDYAQKGLVCVVKNTLSHQQTAWQRFLPTGPLAFLPLPDEQYCSIVWTLPADQADTMLQWEESVFKQALAKALDYRLGEVLSVGERAAFPLQGMHAQQYIAERVALVGDAAHSIHPLAGQGVNLGIKDALALAAHCVPQTLGSRKALRRYERARRADNTLTLKAMEGFDLLFGAEMAWWRGLRNAGLNWMNQQSRLKALIARQALGIGYHRY